MSKPTEENDSYPGYRKEICCTKRQHDMVKAEADVCYPDMLRVHIES